MDLTKLASKLYPRWWRERYGEEFAALLEDARPGIGGTVDIAKGAFAMQFSTFPVSQTIMAGAVLGVALGYSASLFLHPQFTSSAMISVIPAEGLPTVSFGEKINAMTQVALSRGRLSTVVRTLNLYRDERTRMPGEDVLELMKEHIRVQPRAAIVSGKAIPTFELSFNYPDAQTAQLVVAQLVGAYFDENIGGLGEVGPRATLRVLDPASLPARPAYPYRGWIVGAGLGTGTVLAALYALRRRRSANLASVGPTSE